MNRFAVKRWEQLERPLVPHCGGFRVHGFRAPGPITLVLQGGNGWILDGNGMRETITAKTVVHWDTGDLVQYGTDSGFEVEIYWASDLSEEEWAARLTGAFTAD